MKEYSKKHLGKFIWVSVMTVLNSIMFVGISLVLQMAIDSAIIGNIKRAIGLSVEFIIAFALVYWLQASSLVKLNQMMIADIRRNLVKRILSKNIIDFKKYKETDYISLLQNDIKKIEDTYVETLFSIVGACVQLIFAIIVMTHYSWMFTAVMLGMTMLMFVVPTVFQKKLSKATKECSETQQLMTEGFSEIVYGYEVTKSFHKEDYRSKKFEKRNQLMQEKTKTLELCKQANGGVSNVLAFIMQMVICLLAGWFIYCKKMSYGSMVGVIQVSGSITNPLFQLFTWIPMIKSFAPIWEKIENFSKCSDQKDTIERLSKSKTSWDTISLRNVSFAYPGDEKKVLVDINLDIQKGKKYLIVGESGGGKTTLINVLCGNFTPQNGEILVDGKIHMKTSTFLKNLTAVVWQNIFLFNESIAENIMMGDENNEKLDIIINKACIDDLIMEKGKDYFVGSNGDLLSGGQKQRIAIARALYAQKEILALDEGTSALDPKTAKEIEKDFLQKEGLTVISICHHVNPEMQKLYDVIWEMKEGKILKKSY